MAKFTLTFTEPEEDVYEIIETIARQHNLDESEVEKFVHRFTEGGSVTLQFDTEKNKCFVVFSYKEGINDFKDERDVIAKATDIHDKYNEGRKAHIDMLQAQMDEALDAYRNETDKKSSAAKNLLRFIEDTRQELNGFKGANRGEEYPPDEFAANT